MGRKSKLDQSPNKDAYVKLKVGGFSLSELSEEAHKRGEDISPMSFSRWFKRNDPNIISSLKEKLEGATTESVKHKVEHEHTVSVIKEVTKNLFTLQTLTNTLIQENPTDAKTVNACTQLLKESRLTLEYLDRKRKDMLIESEQSEEMAIGSLMQILDRIPLNCPHCSKDLKIIESIEQELTK